MIRYATPADAADIASLIVLAMGPLASTFVNSDDPAVAKSIFEHFAALPDNQYSYQNTLVYQNDVSVCGMICAYNGADLYSLRKPFINYLQKHHNFSGEPEDETQDGEYYIDCLSVIPSMQAQGIGKQLLNALIEKARTNKWPALGLLVSKSNPQAQKLYTNMGFDVVGSKTLLNTSNYHMQHKLL